MAQLNFRIESEQAGSQARAGVFHTLHGEVKTPVFMPVGTQATVKGQTVDSLRAAGSRVLLANTYHLLLRPGAEVFRRFGGIHRFMNWDGPVLTDSGGFQIFSLPHARQMDEEGARFQSYVDGRSFLLSPEESIGMQKCIGSDIMMSLDQCIPSTSEHALAEAAMELTHRWARRSLAARGDSPQALFGIVQGACFHDLRRRSAEFLSALPFDGFAVGGLAVGETREQRDEFTAATAALLPRDLPRYLMGVGTPIDILEAVHRGIDMFDCILPSSLAQRGVAFTSRGKLQLRRSVYKFAEEALDPLCACTTCRNYSRAYLHHLIKADELLGWQLIGSHNLTFYHRMMSEIRESILNQRFIDYYRIKRTELVRSDEDNPIVPPKQHKTRAMRWSRLGDYEVHTAVQGIASIRQISSGEVMHSVSDPLEEANRLYIQQSCLAKRLTDRPLVIWDVGLGAASNAMAAITCFENRLATTLADSDEKGLKGLKGLKRLQILSFERDLDPLRLAAKHPERFAHLRHGAPYSLLEKGEWTHPSGLLEWVLIKGDFLIELEAAMRPDLIFYDPFSFKTDSELWTPSTFSKIYRRCTGGMTELYTYSASTAVRAALLSSGFFVVRGVNTGPKAETTIAFNGLQAAQAQGGLLGEEWLQRWNRSQAKIPLGISPEERESFEKSIVLHPQFAQLMRHQ